MHDPQVFWHPDAHHGAMVPHLDGPAYGIFTPPDRIDWKQTRTYQIGGAAESPGPYASHATHPVGRFTEMRPTGGRCWIVPRMGSMR